MEAIRLALRLTEVSKHNAQEFYSHLTIQISGAQTQSQVLDPLLLPAKATEKTATEKSCLYFEASNFDNYVALFCC